MTAKKESFVTTGVVAFSNLTEHDVYQGKSTGRYSLTLTMTPDEASKLAAKGVNVKEYKGTPQRKFATTYRTKVVDIDDHPIDGEVPYGSTVRVLWSTGPEHPQHGSPTYLNAVRVVEMAEPTIDNEDF